MKPLSTDERGLPARKGIPQLDLPKFLPYRLSVVTERVSRLIAKTYAERFGLSIPEWRVLAHLGRSAGMSAREIGEQTAMDKVKVSRAVARLSARKLVRREVNPLDQRAVLLGLTPAGRTVYESVVPAALEMESAIFSELRPDEVAQFARTLDRIESRIADFAALESDEPADGKLPRRAFRKVAKPRATRRRKPA